MCPFKYEVQILHFFSGDSCAKETPTVDQVSFKSEIPVGREMSGPQSRQYKNKNRKMQNPNMFSLIGRNFSFTIFDPEILLIVPVQLCSFPCQHDIPAVSFILPLL